jgi:transposase, IS30 family
MPCLPLTLEEREEIGARLAADRRASWSSIGAVVGRHRTTVAREVQANGGRDRYRPAIAERRASQYRLRPKPAKLAAGPLRQRVINELSVGRSPYAIHADLAADTSIHTTVCVETIYQAVYRGTLGLKPAHCLRSRRPRRRDRQQRNTNKRTVIATITDRPAAVNDRAEPGHWEVDHIIGKRNRSALMTFTERTSRYCFAITMPVGYNATAALGGLVEGLERIPAHLRRSITFDQGSEWAHWHTIAETYNMNIWFCDPHSPWQRGQIENQNRQWRWWYPRGTNLANLKPAHVDNVAHILNNQRRRHLNNQTPATIYAALTVH